MDKETLADDIAASSLSTEYSAMPEDISDTDDSSGDTGEAPESVVVTNESLFVADPDAVKAEEDKGSGEADDAGEAGEDGLIMGRFKTQEDLIEAFQHQQGVIKGRIKDMPEDEFREVAAERGLLHEAPEAYENAAELMTENGIEPFAEGDEVWDGFYGDLKEAGFTQVQMETMFKIGGPWIQAQIARLGPEVDMDEQKEELQKEWGTDYEATEKAITAFAQANLPSELLYKPLAKTALGHKLLKTIMDQQKGGTPITKTERVATTGDPVKLEKEIDEIMLSEQYQNPHHPDYKTQNKRVDLMMDQLKRIRAGN